MKTPASTGAHPWRQWPHRRRTLQEIICHAAEHQADEPVLTVADRSYTGRDLADVAARCAQFLQRHGVTPGDRVVVATANRREMIELFLGCAWSAAVFTPLNPALRGEMLRHQLRAARPTVVVFDRVTETNLAEASDVFDHPDPVLVRISTEPLDGYADDEVDRHHASVANAVEFQLGETGAEAVTVVPETTAAILFTSGTTGPSKGVIMPHGQFFWWSVICTEQLQLTSADTLYTCLPLFHTNALTTLLQALGAQARAVIGPKFSVSAFWDRLRQSEATVTFLLGAMSSMLWNRKPKVFDKENSALRVILGPGIEPAIKRDFEDHFGVEVAEGFGMTEIGVAFYTPLGQHTEGLLGFPHPDYEVAVVDAADCPLPDGHVGELVIRPRQPALISAGYFNAPEATTSSRRNLWFHTGDLVRKQSDGMYRYVDRLKDSIRRRGENISSYEVEAAFLEHPEVAAAAAIAVPSDLGEDEVMVCLQMTDGSTTEIEKLMAFAEPHLPAFALPRYVRIVAALPLTANGKVSKAVLRNEGVTDDTWEKL
ncbi:AMP-binding protein [Rhodococcus sp. Chr-9]|uniref:AMP-binding protein n=1 Tax=Rhodococcus sp. Chr-9 TaxID=713612 RepID=UPI000A0234BD|nr:AMP-binding protein [Rhodococcus sp. Chr-9]